MLLFARLQGEQSSILLVTWLIPSALGTLWSSSRYLGSSNHTSPITLGGMPILTFSTIGARFRRPRQASFPELAGVACPAWWRAQQ